MIYNMTKIPQFMTIRQTAATGILPEHLLRRLEKQGLLPCVYSGKKCLINFDKLVEQLNQFPLERGTASNSWKQKEPPQSEAADRKCMLS